MIEEYFQKKRAEFMANPDDESLLRELQIIQQERRIQTPENFIKTSRGPDTRRTEP